MVSAKAATFQPTGAFNTTMATGWELKLVSNNGNLIFKTLEVPKITKILAQDYYKHTRAPHYDEGYDFRQNTFPMGNSQSNSS